MTVPAFVACKKKGRPIAMLTAYDHGLASLVDQAGIDGILVGDSLSMVVQGHKTTLPVTLEQMIYHAEMVVRAVRRALVVVDMPFPTFHVSPRRTVAAAARILKETGAPAVKLESSAHQGKTIESLVAAGIPVMAHVGLRPQSVHQLGGYRVQRDADQLLRDARAAEDAGAFAVVLECIPEQLAGQITEQLAIPTIGIGAGVGCDGQILVTHDLLGLTERAPRFVRKYANLRTQILEAIGRYRQDVCDKRFPSEGETYH